MPPPYVTILPEQAERIVRATAETGSAVGVTQSGSTLVLVTGNGTFFIDAKGHDIIPPNQEQFPC